MFVATRKLFFCEIVSFKEPAFSIKVFEIEIEYDLFGNHLCFGAAVVVVRKLINFLCNFYLLTFVPRNRCNVVFFFHSFQTVQNVTQHM